MTAGGNRPPTAAMSRPRWVGRAAVALAAAIVLSGGLALTVRAQSGGLTGREVALGLETACADKAEVLYTVADDDRTVLGRWVTVAGPTFGLPPEAPRPGLMAHAVDPANPSRILVSEGESIQLSENGGCTWSERHFEPSTYGPLNIGGEVGIMDRIRQIEFGGTGKDRRAYALMAPDENQAGAVRVLASDDGGADWEERSVGLPAAYTRYNSSVLICPGRPCPTAVLAAAPGDADVAYVALTDAVAPSLFRTGDGGRSWTRIPLTSTIGGEIAELQVSPLDPEDVWAVFTDQLGRSRDGGRTWEFPEGTVGVAGLHLSSGPSPVHVQVLRRGSNFQSPFDRLLRSVDDGASFTAFDLEQPLTGVLAPTPGGPADELILSSDAPDRVVGLDASVPTFVNLSALGLGDVTTPRRDATPEPAYWFRQFAGIAAFVPGPLPPGRFPPPAKLPYKPGAAVDLGAGRVPGDLHPADLTLELGREGSQAVDYRLELPALPTPVDIYFLIDTSGSMGGAIEGLQEGIETIIEELTASGLDAWFGLGTFPAQSVIYDRKADVGPPGPEFYDALSDLKTDGQTNEIHATALYQSVTGAGQEDAGIPEGRGATFRPQALKIIVHATDEAYGTQPTGPSEEEAAEALAAAGVRHVGLDLAAGAVDSSAGADENGPRSTKDGHDAMAIATGTLAPPGGIDCNGDGENELDEGDPITCPIVRGRDSLDIAPAIISAVRAVRDETEVALNVVDGGGADVQIVDPRRSPVNLKVANTLPFSVNYRCPAEMVGKVAEVRLQATVRGMPSAEGVAQLGCGVEVPPPAPPRPQPPAPVVPMVIAPPQVVPDLEPAISPLHQPAPGHVATPTAQPGLAAQPGEVATAKQRAGRDGPAPPSPSSGESPERNSAPATAGTLGAGAALSVALGGWAVRRDRRTVVAPARA